MCHLTITTLSLTSRRKHFPDLYHNNFFALLYSFAICLLSTVCITNNNSVLLFFFWVLRVELYSMLFCAWFIFFSTITLTFICFVVYSCNSNMHSIIYYQLYCWCILNHSWFWDTLNIAALITLVYTYVLTSVLWNQLHILQFNSILTLSVQSCCRPPKLKI